MEALSRSLHGSDAKDVDDIQLQVIQKCASSLLK